MPLPPGTLKTKLQLATQADTTYKDNGGADVTKTQGSNVRQFLSDLLESSNLTNNDFAETRLGTNVILDKEANYFKTAGFTPNTDTIGVLVTGAINGCVAKLYHKDIAEPTLNFTGFNAVYKAALTESYNPSKLNIYVFSAIRNGSVVICEWTRFTADVI